MRREGPCRELDGLGKLGQCAEQVQFGFLPKLLQPDVAPRREHHAALGGHSKEAGDAGVCVLHVVHGVVHGLAGDGFDVEVDGRVG